MLAFTFVSFAPLNFGHITHNKIPFLQLHISIFNPLHVQPVSIYFFFLLFAPFIYFFLVINIHSHSHWNFRRIFECVMFIHFYSFSKVVLFFLLSFHLISFPFNVTIHDGDCNQHIFLISCSYTFIHLFNFILSFRMGFSRVNSWRTWTMYVNYFRLLRSYNRINRVWMCVRK